LRFEIDAGIAEGSQAPVRASDFTDAPVDTQKHFDLQSTPAIDCQRQSPSFPGRRDDRRMTVP
jgi:hypothetical protein